MADQIILFVVIIATLVLFVSNRWRFDIISVLALITLALFGIIPQDRIFYGISHPAVITVVAILIISRALINAGITDLISGWLFKIKKSPILLIFSVTGLVAIASAFINNIGVVALFIPVAIQLARKNEISPSLLLIPIAFGSLLGGLSTMIGTPSNILIAMAREGAFGLPFQIFDFAPVGATLAFLGVIFITILGWRFLPQRKIRPLPEEAFEIKGYITEFIIPEGSKLLGKPLRELEVLAGEYISVMGLIRNNDYIPVPSSMEILKEGDVISVKAEPEIIKTLSEKVGLDLVGSKEIGIKKLESENSKITEVVVKSDSIMIGSTANELNLRWRYGINLIAVSRGGKSIKERLDKIRFQNGDVLIFQGEEGLLRDSINLLGCLPLVERELKMGRKKQLIGVSMIFLGAIILALTNLVHIQVALVIGVLLIVLARLISIKEIYKGIEWPVIILLGAMIPIGDALEKTGGSNLIADSLLGLGSSFSPLVILGILLVVSMILSNIVSNIASTVLMAPIAISLAGILGASIDPFLMAVAVGVAAPFITPIGHQSNILIFEAGGYKFGDFWRVGLPLSILVVAFSVPLINYFWPMF